MFTMYLKRTLIGGVLLLLFMLVACGGPGAPTGSAPADGRSVGNGSTPISTQAGTTAATPASSTAAASSTSTPATGAGTGTGTGPIVITSPTPLPGGNPNSQLVTL